MDALLQEQRISKRAADFAFFPQYFQLLGARWAPTFGSPEDAETGLLEAGFEFRLLSDPPARKSSANLLTEPA